MVVVATIAGAIVLGAAFAWILAVAAGKTSPQCDPAIREDREVALLESWLELPDAHR